MNCFLQSDEIPLDWGLANITPIFMFKKGNCSTPSNYRPTSLTSVTSKLLEHIIVSNMMNHLENNNILVDCQHVFWQRWSCETQLITFVNELLESMDNGIETDMIAQQSIWYCAQETSRLHRRLLEKLTYYGITTQFLAWIENFLCHQKQRVTVDGQVSDRWIHKCHIWSSTGHCFGTYSIPFLYEWPSWQFRVTC